MQKQTFLKLLKNKHFTLIILTNQIIQHKILLVILNKIVQ